MTEEPRRKENESTEEEKDDGPKISIIFEGEGSLEVAESLSCAERSHIKTLVETVLTTMETEENKMGTQHEEEDEKWRKIMDNMSVELGPCTEATLVADSVLIKDVRGNLVNKIFLKEEQWEKIGELFRRGGE